jgi:hypothetical protein
LQRLCTHDGAPGEEGKGRQRHVQERAKQEKHAGGSAVQGPCFRCPAASDGCRARMQHRKHRSRAHKRVHQATRAQQAKDSARSARLRTRDKAASFAKKRAAQVRARALLLPCLPSAPQHWAHLEGQLTFWRMSGGGRGGKGDGGGWRRSRRSGAAPHERPEPRARRALNSGCSASRSLPARRGAVHRPPACTCRSAAARAAARRADGAGLGQAQEQRAQRRERLPAHAAMLAAGVPLHLSPPGAEPFSRQPSRHSAAEHARRPRVVDSRQPPSASAPARLAPARAVRANAARPRCCGQLSTARAGSSEASACQQTKMDQRQA